MSVLINQNSKVVVQGFTGGEGTFHSKEMLAYGTNIVAGVTPGKGGIIHLDRPVFNSVSEAKLQFENDVLLKDEYYNEFIGCKIHSKHLK